MTVSEARSRCAALQVLGWNDDPIGIEVVRATASFIQASPQVTPAAGAPGLWWIGASGLSPRDGRGEAEFVRTVLTLARRWHPLARVAIADSCVAARAATWDRMSIASGTLIVPPGGCAAYLARAPLGMMTMDEDLLESLRALGLRTIGELARLSAEDVERRWGALGLAAWRLAHGQDERRPGLLRLDTARAVTTDLYPSVSTTEPILFLARAALERLLTGLIADGRSAAVVAITLALDDVRNALPVPSLTHTITREIRLPRPLARLAPLLERCRALLDDWPLTAPVRAATIAVTATAPLSGAQGELLDPSWRDPAAADAAFARLRSALGTDVVVRPVLRDSHRPEAAAIWERVEEVRGEEIGDWRLEIGRSRVSERPEPETKGKEIRGRHLETAEASQSPITNLQSPLSNPQSPIPDLQSPAAALRQLDPPERIDVTIADDRPQTLRWRNRWVRIQRAIGPERLTGEWWDAQYARDYWRCEDADTGASLMVYHDIGAPADDLWFVQGWYD
jgi:nucleotidyltransferase/DNA polymerase involved in DNA repair